MINFKIVRQRLKDYERSLECGSALKTLQALNLLLAQLNCDEAQGTLASGAVLLLMSRAAAALHDEESAAYFLSRAVDLLHSPQDECGGEADVFLSLADTLLSRACLREALHFAQAALETAASRPADFEEEELADILRRYARIARYCGVTHSAYLALAAALLIIHDSCGIESEAGSELLTISEMLPRDASEQAVAKIAEHLLRVRESGCRLEPSVKSAGA